MLDATDASAFGRDSVVDGAGAGPDANGDVSTGPDGAAQILADAATADTERDVPFSDVDSAAGTDGQPTVDAPMAPDTLAERDAPVAGAGGAGTGGTGGAGGITGAPDAYPDVPLTADGAGGVNSGGATGSNGGVGGNGSGGGGATASGGSTEASAGNSAVGGSASGGAISTTAGTTAGGGATTKGNSSSASGGAGGITTGGTGGGATGGDSATGGSSQIGLWSGCKMLLHMDEATWNGTAGEVKDDSGANNAGTAIAGPVTTDSPARLGRAGLFFGSGYLSVPDASSLHAGGAFSVSAWVYPTALNGTSAPGIVSKRIGYGNGTEFAVFAWTNNHVFVDVDSEDHRFESVAVLNTNTWYHIAVVFDGAADPSERVRLYINGQLDTVHAHTSTTVPPSNAAITIGNLPDGGQLFSGAIDEVAFWQRALSAAEVASLSQ